MRRVLVTGAAGGVGRAVLPGLLRQGYALRLVDRVPVDAAVRDGDEVVVADLGAPGVAASVVAGVEAVIHLAGNPSEAPLARELHDNVTLVGDLLEACRLGGVRRFVQASTNHVTGYLPVGIPVGPTTPPRPDTFYGVSKVAAEGLVSLYADKFGITGVCVRIGSQRPAPLEPRELATWLSNADAAELLHRAVVADVGPFLVVYGMSDNAAGWWSRDGWAELGYVPRDRAELHAAGLGGLGGPGGPGGGDGSALTRQGGDFADAAVTLAVLPGSAG